MAESRKRFPGRSGRNTLPVPRDLQLPPTKRDQPAFREQRKQKLKEYLLIRKTMLPYKQENQISRDQQVMTVEDPVQEGKKVLKLKTEMADKENIDNTVEKNCIPLKADEVTSSEIHNLKDNIQAVQDQACHLKDNKKVQAATEKPKQDANMLKKRVLGYYHGQVVQSKINSFRKLANVKGETPAATKKPPATMSKASKAQSAPGNAVSIRASSVSAAATFVKTKSVSSPSRNTLVRPPVRSSLHSNAQGAGKQGPARTLANVTVRKGPLEKDSRQSERVVSVVDTRPQDTKRDEAPSRSIASEGVARTNLSNTRLMEKSKAIDQRRYSVAGAAVHRSVQPRESTEDRKARMTEWRTGKGKGLKRPPNLIAHQSEPQGQNKNPTGSFWTTMAEEDEQRVFTEKVNKTILECLNLINKKGCPKEEILDTLNDLISNIPDAKKLVKYWICLVRLEPITSPIENIISIYEKAILAGAQPIEEMRQTIIDILTTKSQEKVNLGENTEEAHETKGHSQEVKTEDTSVTLEPGDPGAENECQRNVQVCENSQDQEAKDPTNDFTTPDSKTEAGCLIKYNVSSTPCLQSMKKMQHGKNSTFKELKFLTPVRRSRRIQEKTSQLPDMLKDHDPSVSSLEQLSDLGEDAFVCRPNAALYPLFSETDLAGQKQCS
ncbi:cytoskeleton-associated protein 2 isoform X1 [Microtus oregoni]|uniref:cytoskeleton-associated protein 2 isoform X1 n=3 Tax=Microtus oregoni TaxID=111838 RepID=UPI001BB14C05|nr:cytoskeleton-associated protein 2 isoform X1 [Microtus oregoni]